MFPSDVWHNIASLLTFDPQSPLLFTSGTFWVLFLLFLPIYALLKRKLWKMMIFVLLFSLYFYYKCSGLFVCVLVATSGIDWCISKAIATPGRSKAFRIAGVSLSLLCSLGILAFFKYANFFIWNYQAIVGGNFRPLDIILPVGISFYTFQSVSYIIDVYKGRVQPTRTWLEYAFYLTFFPALVAGPIVRADYFLPQIRENRQPSHSEIYAGLWLIILGIVKKAVIADYIAQYNDLVFNTPGGYDGFECLMGVIGYTMQIYCDFSGYSDMAIGLAAIMGFRLAQNFNFPYKSRNISDFWRRWHISLSSWLRDYIYIPLGGNRKGKVRTYINNIITMFIGGLWHGASWKFVFWGVMHGVALVVHKATRPLMSRLGDGAAVKTLCWLLTMSFVSIMWVFFRADSWEDSLLILYSLAGDYSPAKIAAFAAARSVWLILMTVIIISHCLPTAVWKRASEAFVRTPWLVKLLLFIVVVQIVIELRGESVVPFIYFQF